MDSGRLQKLLADMVAIPSVNPLDGPVGEGRGEAQLAGFVASQLEEAGIDHEEREAAPGRPSVLATIPGEQEDSVWFDAHLDTVSGEGMEGEPFSPRIEEGALCGRGAADDKGSLAAMVAALARVAASGKKPPYTVIFSATADEEHLMLGLHSLLESGLRARGVIVGEPTALRIVVAHKGVVRFTIATRGKAAHGSRPEEGVNAIYRMSRVLQAVEAFARGGVGRENHPLLGKATLMVGRIYGGEHFNVVPDRCEIHLDRRLLPGEEARKAVAEVRSYLASAIDEDLGLQVSAPHLAVPGMSLSADHPLAQAVSAAVREVTGKAPIHGMTGTTHAGPLNAAGIPALVFGPGEEGQAHTATERLDLEQLEQAAQVYEKLMWSGTGS